jgi:hypothetical protein
LRSANIGGIGTVILQVAITMVLVSMAVAATRHFVGVLRQPLGFAPENVVTVVTEPRGTDRLAFWIEAVHNLAERPDVVSVGAAEALPLGNIVPRENIPVTGADPVSVVRTLPGYFEAAGIRLLQGRLFEWQDSAVSSLAIASESAAALLFPGRDPLGQQMKSAKGGLFTVIGIVNDVRMTPARPHDPLVYAIVDPSFNGRLALIARLRGRSPQAPQEIRQYVGSMLREMPVTTSWWSAAITSLAEYRTPRFQTIVLGTLATLATTLAALGLFGVVSYSTKQRMHEIAIRVALGAMPESVTRRLALRMAGPVIIGLLAGLVGTWLLGRVLTAYLVGFRGWEWQVLTGAATLIAATAWLSTHLPARKASRLPAMKVLRSL